ncbi:MAG TPA: DUF6708 domain-containing protein [Paraburkholderia sp.]|jgi:hypothetical protein|uniref:DUF6708 domain-containing protein n=1 Tax=Paraburkholderia sp. TaxID=1926495 RepID=UPI002B468369|nr:DUF6708 domain-containing protein [Paraburkholderia sp.]HKR44423.1 DUF6708 domain-containing protein [Paraburkholderia sp.]
MYDYLTSVDVNCPVDESEEKRRLNVQKPAADKTEDGYVVFEMNGVYLDVCNASYQQLGWGTLAFLIGFPAAAYGGWQTALFTRYGELVPVFWALVAGWTLIGVLTVVLLFRDCFGYRHKTVRFNRKNRMVYAFRRNGPGGVVAVPWDKAFFFPHRQTSVAIFGGAPTVMRCYVMAEDGKTIKDTFSFGVRVVNGDDETDEWGKKVLGEVLANFEFIRRFMEDGPEHLTVDRYMPKGPSLKASFSIWFDGFKEVGSVAKVLMAFVALPTVILATLHYIAQLTSREPVWPDYVQRASASDETSVTVIA